MSNQKRINILMGNTYSTEADLEVGRTVDEVAVDSAGVGLGAGERSAVLLHDGQRSLGGRDRELQTHEGVGLGRGMETSGTGIRVVRQSRSVPSKGA